MNRLRMRFAGLLLLAASAPMLGCQARQAVNQYASFDAVITDLYEKHVLQNLARRDLGRTMVQMQYSGFSANLTYNTTMTGKVQFFTNPQAIDGADGTSISLNAFRQAFEPNLSNSTGGGLGINSAPAPDQAAIRDLYDAQVNRPEDERVYRRTTHPLVAMRAYCYIRTAQRDLYYVPHDKHREFADFVHQVSFYKPAPPATAPASTSPSGPPR